MPLFEYIVKDESGKNLSGVQEAESVQALITVFRQKNYTVIKLQGAKKGVVSSRLRVRQKKKRIR